MKNDEDDGFVDVNGDPYSAALKYYQPYEPDGQLTDKNGKNWASFQVWLDKRTCEALFPGKEIREYSGAEIEEPEFVDAQIGGTAKHDPIRDSFPVKVLDEDGDNPPKGKTTCGYCLLSWDDNISTAWTPVPSGRCPFEYQHRH